MSLHFEITGPKDLPILFCIHGLLGGPESFLMMKETWKTKFCVVVVDLHSHMRSGGLLKIDERSMTALHYDGAGEEILNFLEHEFPGRSCYFVGLSLGGKISYEFAGRAPERFLGAVVTDVGPGSLNDSTLYQFVSTTIPSVDLNLPWSELKQQLAEKVPERNLRIMLQSQLHYPTPGGAAVWRAGLSGLSDLLAQQSIADQWPALNRYAAYLEATRPNPRPQFIVYKASSLSAISEQQLSEMEALEFLEIRPVSGTNHFIQITHRDEIEESVMALLPVEEASSSPTRRWLASPGEQRC